MNLIKHQAGLSIIELMIALVISSFLILGITQIFIDNKRNYAFQQTQASNLDSGRFASLVLNEYLSKTGYHRDPSQLPEDAFPDKAADADCLAFTAGSAITGHTSKAGFCVRYQVRVDKELDCQGQEVSFDDSTAFSSPPTTSMIIMAFKYEPDPNNKLEQGSLQCKSLNATAPAYVELIKGVAGFRINFGVGKADPLDKEIKNFVSQKDWGVSSGNIRNVSYSILLSSRENQRDNDDSKILSDWRATATTAEKAIIDTNDKKRLYQVASSTLTLRNLMP